MDLSMNRIKPQEKLGVGIYAFLKKSSFEEELYRRVDSFYENQINKNIGSYLKLDKSLKTNVVKIKKLEETFVLTEGFDLDELFKKDDSRQKLTQRQSYFIKSYLDLEKNQLQLRNNVEATIKKKNLNQLLKRAFHESRIEGRSVSFLKNNL